MGASSFLKRITKHKRYFYLSLVIIAGFFGGSALIIPSITSVSENLLEELIEENVISTKTLITSEFTRRNSLLEDSEKLLETAAEVPFEDLMEKLLVTTQRTELTDLISNSFIYVVSPQGVEEVHLAATSTGVHPSSSIEQFKPSEFSSDAAFAGTIIKTPQGVVNRRMYAKKIAGDTTVIVGYDYDLLAFWEYYSEKNPGKSGYTVVTTLDGSCILHPEPQVIGSKLPGFFQTISIDTILQQPEVLKDKAHSEFLDFEVQRYFDDIRVGDSSYIVIESFPLNLIVEDTTEKIHHYFIWISLLAFLTFILLLVVSRLQLRREYLENLKVLEEKEQLKNTNEKYQRENAVLQLNQLKEKMNPHFLFNSLNSLHVLIATKPEVSQQFVLRLADVYRYFLENKEGDLVPVHQEINFLKKYVFLQEIRFNRSLNSSIINTSNDQVLSKKIPFMSLQTLMENAIKHNNITKNHPLTIEVIIKESVIVVQNNYNPRKSTDKNSHKLGLNYLHNIYAHHQVTNFETAIVDGKFKVILPLLT